MAGNYWKLVVFIVTVTTHAAMGQGDPTAAPSLVITPTSYNVEYGSTVLMTCVAYLGPDTEDHSSTTLAWIDPSGAQLRNDSDSLVTVYTSVQSEGGSVFLESILEICGIGLAGVGEYRCTATNSIGADTFSWNISFTEEVAPPELAITPVSQNVSYGDTVLMACVASGYPQPEISWSRNGELLNPDSYELISVYDQVVSGMGLNFTESILEICGFSEDDVGSFVCTASSEAGSVNSSMWSLDILPNSTEVSIVITPASDTVDVESTVLLVCVALGQPPPSISWEFSGSLISNETSYRHTIYEQTMNENGLNFVESILEICSIELDEGGVYTCNASNGFTSVTNSTTLTVADNRETPSIVIRPNVTEPFLEGDTVQMVCTATGRPFPSIQWYKDGVLLTNDSLSLTSIYNEEFESSDQLFTSSILELCSVGVESMGTYSCQAFNSAGNDSVEFDIQITPGEASVVISPSDYSVDEGSTVLAVCVGTGFPQPSISWSLNGSQLDNDSRVTIYEEVTVQAGMTFVESILEVCGVTLLDGGLFECTVSNRLVNSTANFTLTVNDVVDPPQLVITPNSTFEVDAGATVTYVCVGFSQDEPPDIFWRFGDELLSNETSSLVTVYESQVEGNNLVFTESILELCSVELENDGMYSCTASNSAGSSSSNFTLSVRPRIPPSIVIRPNVTEPFLEGDTVQMVCTATGRPFPSIQWYKDGVLLTNDSLSLTSIYTEEFESNDQLFTSSILELCSVGVDSMGTYSCLALNPAGNDSVEFDVQITPGEASVVISPSDYSVDEGSTVLAVCVGTGFPQPSISWSLNGNQLDNDSRVTIYEEVTVQAGMTFVESILEVCGVTLLDGGLFECTVSNRLVNSTANFTLTVNDVVDPPQLVITPNSTFEVDAGATVTYVCVGFSQDEPPNIFWRFGDELLSNETSSLVTIYESQVEGNNLVFTESILELCSVEVENDGMYSCTANNSAGSSSSNFTLSVRPRIPPSIVIRPNVTEPFLEGDTVQMVCTATGRPFPSIQWYKDGVLLTNDSLSLISIYNEEFESSDQLFTSSILELCSVGVDSMGTYSCLALNPAGNDSVEFDVQITPGEASVVISPSDYSVDEGSTVLAVCVGTGFPQPSISWSFNGNQLDNDSRVTIYEEVTEQAGMTFVESILEVCGVTLLDGGLFECAVSNRLVNSTANFTLTVNDIIEPPQLVITPNSTFEVDVGATVTYVCVAYGESERPSIFWRFGDELLSNETSSLVTVYESQVEGNNLVFTESILELCSVDVENAGMYSCTANNSIGSSNSTFTLNVRPNIPPSIVIRPNVTEPFREGDTVQMVCTATGRPSPSIQWYKDGVLLTNDSLSLTSIYTEEFESNDQLFTSSILELCSVGVETMGTYSCLALSPAGNDSVEFDVQITLEPPQLVITPNSTFEVDAGATVTYVCVGFSQDEPPSIFWRFGDELLSNETSSLVTVYESQVEGNNLVFTESILELCSVDVENAGMYSCTANNSIGSSNSTFTLNVRPNIPPSIVIRPNITEPFREGDTVQMVCTATGRPFPSIQWYKDGLLLTNDSLSLTSIYTEEFESNDQQFTSSILELCSVGVETMGTYSCLALSPAGNDSVEFDVQITLEPPQLVITPNSTFEVDVGATVTYVCVGFSRDDPPSIFWRFGDELLSNETSSLVTVYESQVEGNNLVFTESILELCSVELENDGMYSCTANNSRGSNRSNFTLSVRPPVPPSIVIRPNITEPFLEGDTINLVCTATGRPFPTIQWYRNGVLLTNDSLSLTSIYDEQLESSGLLFTSSILEICSVRANDTGTYSCQAFNPAGNDSVEFGIQIEPVDATVVVAPSNYTIDEMTTLVAVCVGTGFPQPSISWSFRGNQLENGSRVNITEEVFEEAGETFVRSFLELCSVTILDEGLYQCTVANRLVNDSAFFALDVNSVGVHPQLVITPNSTFEVDAGATVTYVCVAYGEDEPPSIFWRFGNELLENGSSPLVTVYESQVVENNLVFTESILELCSVEVENAGMYSCTANNSRGSNSSAFTLIVNNVAEIVVAPPTDVSVRGGETLMVVCVGVGLDPQISWSKNGNTITNDTDDRVSLYNELSTQRNVQYAQSILEICSAEPSDEGNYICTVTSRTVSNSVNFTLSVNVTPAAIVIGPSNSYPVFNSSLFLTCVASGFPLPTVSWYREGVLVTDADNIETEVLEEREVRYIQSTLLLCSVQETAEYSCSVSNGVSGGAVTSFATNVTVQVPVSVTAQPVDQTVLAGATVTFSCSAYGTAPITIDWFKTNPRIGETTPQLVSDRVTQTDVGTTEVTATSVLTLPSGVGVADDGSVFYCVVQNNLTEAGEFSNQSDSVTLTVQSVPVVSPTPSATVVGVVGSGVTIGVMIDSAYPELTANQIVWYRAEDLATPLTAATSKYEFNNNMRSLYIYPVSYEDEGDYVININHVTGNQTVTIHVNVQAAAMIVGGPRNTQVPLGQSASFSCNVTAEPIPTIAWEFNGTGIIDGSKYTITTTSTVSMTTMSELTVNNLMVNDTGLYSCFVENIHGNETSTASLLVQTAPIVTADTQMDLTLLGEGFKIVFSISNDVPEVSPADTTWTFTSSRSGVEVVLNESSDGRIRFSDDKLTLTISSVSLLDDGVYRVSATNPAGSDSDLTTVSVYAAPYISSTGRDDLLDAGSRVSFNCTADGVPTPSITWLKDGTVIRPSAGKKYELKPELLAGGLRDNINETASSVLTVIGILESDAGLYTCTATNGRGQNAAIDMPFNLSVIPAPPPNYCQTNPCVNGATCESGATTFLCKCTDGFKGTICDEEIVSNSPPTIVQGPQTAFVGIYSSVNLTCVVSGSPQPTIQWYKDDALLPGEVFPSYFIQSVELDDRGVYHCEATNNQGTVRSQMAVVNILGIQQYVVELFIPLVGFQVSSFSQPVIDKSKELVSSLNEQLAGQVISGVLIFTVTQLGTDDQFVMYNEETKIVKLSIVLTVLVLPGTFVGRNLFVGESFITPEILMEFTEEIEDTTNNLGFEVNVTTPSRLDGCFTEQTQFAPTNSDQSRVLTWVEASIGAEATTSCPCGVEFGRQATRVCMGNFTTGGTWGEVNYTLCEFTEKTWRLCDAAEDGSNGVAVVLETTSTPDQDHLGIVVSIAYIEQEMGGASGNADATDQLFDIMDNLLRYPIDVLKNAHEEFNTSARIMAAMDRLSDSYPVTDMPHLIVKDMYVIIIYDPLSAQAFLGQAVFADIGTEFVVDAFQDSHIKFDSYNGDPTASISLPSSLLREAGLTTGDHHRIVFNFFLNDGLFVRRDSFVRANGLSNDKLGGLAVAAHIAGDVKVADLEAAVNMTFVINPSYRTGGNTTCSFWDQSLDNYYGGWSSRGCTKVSGNSGGVSCACDHLTSFGLVVDTSPRPVAHDSSILPFTSLGPVFLILLLLVVIFSYLISGVRSSTTGIFLFNLCGSLLALSVCYIISNYVIVNVAVCQLFSFLFQFSLLVSCGALAILLFFMIYTPYTGAAKRIAFTAAIFVNLVVSAIVSIVSIAPTPDSYFNDQFCRPASYPFWFGLLLVGGVEMIATAILFVVGIVMRLRTPRNKENGDRQWWMEFTGLFIIFILFYVAWGFGLPALHPLNLGLIRVVFQVIFIAAIITLGIIMVVFFCVLSPEIREAWKNLIGRFMPGRSKAFSTRERADVEGNIYMTNRSPAELKLAEDDNAMQDVSFTFTGNTFENPVAQEYDDDKPTKQQKGAEDEDVGVATGGEMGVTDGDDDSVVKVDLSSQLDAEEELTKL